MTTENPYRNLPPEKLEQDNNYPILLAANAWDRGYAAAVADLNVTVIDADQFERARRDPKVLTMQEAAREYADKLVARGHCRCHLAVNCPNEERNDSVDQK